MIGCGLVDPKRWVNSVAKSCMSFMITGDFSKGNPVNIPELELACYGGNAKELGDVGKGPGKSFLFFLTCK